MTPPPNRSEIHCYGANPVYYILLLSTLGPLAAWSVWMLINFSHYGPLGFLLCPIIVPAFLGMLWWVWYLRVELSPEGVRIRIPLQTVSAPWSNIVTIQFGYSAQGFVTAEPMEGSGAAVMAANSGWIINGGAVNSPNERRFMEARQFMPLKGFMWNFRRRSFVDQIERFAPHLGLRAALTPKPETPESRARNIESWKKAAPGGLGCLLALILAILGVHCLAHRDDALPKKPRVPSKSQR